jgi:hypothetical protein
MIVFYSHGIFTAVHGNVPEGAMTSTFGSGTTEPSAEPSQPIKTVHFIAQPDKFHSSWHAANKFPISTARS